MLQRSSVAVHGPPRCTYCRSRASHNMVDASMQCRRLDSPRPCNISLLGGEVQTTTWSTLHCSIAALALRPRRSAAGKVPSTTQPTLQCSFVCLDSSRPGSSAASEVPVTTRSALQCSVAALSCHAHGAASPAAALAPLQRPRPRLVAPPPQCLLQCSAAVLDLSRRGQPRLLNCSTAGE